MMAIRSVRQLIAFGIICGISIGMPAVAQDFVPPSVVFKAGAGEFDSKGWAIAPSTEGGFVVKTPCPYNDMTLGKTDASGRTLPPRMFSVACERTDRVRFTAIRFEFVAGISKEMTLDGLANSLNLPSSAITSGKLDAFETREVKFETSERCFFARIVKLKRDFLITMVEPVGVILPCAALRGDAAEFLESLKVTRS